MWQLIDLDPSLANAGATILAAIIVSIISIYYYWHSKKMEYDRMMKDLFKEFNARYDKINRSLHEIEKKCKNLKDFENHPKLEYRLNDFFNLCAEEYFWYKKGRIDNTIWNAWHDGMNDWYHGVDIIKEAWEAEIKKRGCKSYYIKDKNEFFKK